MISSQNSIPFLGLAGPLGPLDSLVRQDKQGQEVNRHVDEGGAMGSTVIVLVSSGSLSGGWLMPLTFAALLSGLPCTTTHI